MKINSEVNSASWWYSTIAGIYPKKCYVTFESLLAANVHSQAHANTSPGLPSWGISIVCAFGLLLNRIQSMDVAVVGPV